MYLSAVHVFLSLTFLVQPKRVVNRSWREVIYQEIPRPAAYDENIEVENLTVKRKDSLTISDATVKQPRHLQEDYSCDCRDYCPDPNNTELQVSGTVNLHLG